LTLTVRGAARLAVVGLPGGVVSAVPLVWRFVRDVLRELRRRDTALRPAV
jgi:molybdopterin biosynthesis enzyme